MKKISINIMKIVVVLMIGIFAIGMSLGVNAAEVKNIIVKVKGELTYGLNEEIEEDKFQFIAVDTEDWKKDITEEVEIAYPELDELGEHELVAKYGDKVFTFIITVVEPEEVPEEVPGEETEVIVTPEDPEDPEDQPEDPEDPEDQPEDPEDQPEDPEDQPEDQPEDDMEDIVEDATDGGFDFMGTMSGLMEFLQPLLDTLLNSILPMIMNTVLPMAVDAASTLIPMAIDVGVPAITTLIGAIF